MKYWLSLLLILIAIALVGLGVFFKQVDLDIAGVLVAVVAVGIFLWSSLHLSLRLRSPRQRRYDISNPRSDEEQAAALRNVIFQPKNDPNAD